ncbi:MAG: tRNA (adenosine(37)-N6)-threonylcarbamoyltransferase complex transferase subunit TsaD [Candidatus Acidiferrum sp.]|jgi:N6-L-threonylcarbamoyladenine synthase
MTATILGIESSCDETAAAVVSDGRRILSSVVASQISIHRKYGGVVPELASREHLRQIVPVVREALLQAEIDFHGLDAIGVTRGPGLVGALLVGITYGKTLAAALDIPLVPVNHLEGHVHAVFLEAAQAGKGAKLPAVCLIVSGGHTVIYEVRAEEGAGNNARQPAPGSKPGLQAPAPAENESGHGLHPGLLGPQGLFSYRKMGGTRDDAAGEAYDKVAKLLALGYPGGPILDRLAACAAAAPPIKFSPTKIKGNAYDFSFSGMKTAVLYHLREHPEYHEEIHERNSAIERGERSFDQLLPLCSPQTLALIHEFQNAVVRDLLERTMAAAESISAASVLVSGGVAANSALRAAFEERGRASGIAVFFPSRALSTDNAAMIAAAAYPRFRAGIFAGAELNADPALALA